MVLSDSYNFAQVIGCLMKNPLFLLEYSDIVPTDFDTQLLRICFITIHKLYNEGVKQLTPIELDQEIERYESSFAVYKADGGLEFLNYAYEIALPSNFEKYYNTLKKSSLLRRLKKEGYDISAYYIPDMKINDPLRIRQAQELFDQSSVEDILNNVEGKYNLIRNEYLNGGRTKGDPAEGIFSLIEDLRARPSVGPSLEGAIFSSACRGAREGCFFLKSASTNCGKTRTAVFDACRLAFPERWSRDKNNFIIEATRDGEIRQPRKVLFIVTEMDREELQTIILAYLSGVNEDAILNGKYEFGEYSRVQYAGHILEKYSGNFIIEEISEPNLTNVEATIKKYATIDGIKYCFFDYIHTTASLVEQFSRNNLREDVVLMLLANQLKQLAKDYQIFISSATQVNAGGMGDDEMAFKDEKCIRGSKAVADKCDIGYVMSRVSEKGWNSIAPTLRAAAREGIIDKKYVEDSSWRPTHVLDIYKMRRGRYKGVRIWINIDLGTGARRDLFMTTAENNPIPFSTDLFNSASEIIVEGWQEEI